MAPLSSHAKSSASQLVLFWHAVSTFLMPWNSRLKIIKDALKKERADPTISF